MSKQVLPYNDPSLSKKQQVESMFDNIASSYDFLNHFLSMGIDKSWRKKTVRSIGSVNPKLILDVATGTGDLAVALMKLNPEKVIGLDLSEKMLVVARKKILKKNLQHKIEFLKGDSEKLPFEDNKFDALTVGFGVRNFENLEKGIGEMHRVIRQGGMVAVLEFSKPKKFPIKQLFGFYFKRLLPFIGRKVSKDKRAYTYLPESVQAFQEGEGFLKILEKAGFKSVKCRNLFFGVASIYTGVK